jgi:hypothetical protein
MGDMVSTPSRQRIAGPRACDRRAGVVRHLLAEGTLEVHPQGAANVENPDDRVDELYLAHRAVRQLVVHQILAVTLERL